MTPSFSRRALLLGTSALPMIALLGGCDSPGRGPVEVRYDRDTCSLCRMMISDRRFAAQAVGGPDGVEARFDDIGCAVKWLDEQGLADAESVGVWVNDHDNPGAWLNAREAAYLTGLISPMNHGFGAVSDARDGTVDYAAVREVVRNAPAKPMMNMDMNTGWRRPAQGHRARGLA